MPCNRRYKNPNGFTEVQMVHERQRLRVVLWQCSATCSQVRKMNSPVCEAPAQVVVRAAFRVTARPVESRDHNIGDGVSENVCAARSTLAARRGCNCSNCGERSFAVRVNRWRRSTCCSQLLRKLHEEFSSVSRGSRWLRVVASSDVQDYSRVLVT